MRIIGRVLSIHDDKLIAALALCSTTAALVACDSESDTPVKPSRTGGKIDPGNFVLPVDNPFFPLKPGTTYRHEGVKEGRPAVDVFNVTPRTKEIMGVTNTVVVDKLYVDGRLEEIAHDWYTQDRLSLPREPGRGRRRTATASSRSRPG